jgi:hypothetical protein
METPANTGRDPVCESIEALFNDLHTKGVGTFARTDKNGMVQLSFGTLNSEGATYDIALVRLAKAMMDDEKHNHALMDTLRGQMTAGRS